MAPAWRNSYLRYKTYFLNISSQYSKREDVRAYLELLLSLATVSIFAIFAIRPTLITIAQLFKEIEAKKATVAQLDQKINDLSSAQKIYDEEKNNIALLEIAVPKNPNPDSLVLQMEGAIGQNNVEVLAINVGGATLLGTPKEAATTKTAPLPEGASSLGLSLSFSSDYPALASLISDLERLRRPVKIDNLNISSSVTAEGQELILVVNGRTPYLRDEVVAGAP